MTRTLTAGVSTALADARLRDAILVYFNFDSGAVRVWSGIGDLISGGQTFLGTGLLGSISSIVESSSLKSVGMSFTLSGIPSAMISIVLGEHYQGRTVTVWRAFFDAGDVLIANPIQVFSGRLDVMEIHDAGETITVNVNAENRLIDLQRPNEIRFYTDQDQQKFFPGDVGFEFVPALKEKILWWGRKEVGEKKTADATGGVTPTTGGSETTVVTVDETGQSTSRVVSAGGTDETGAALLSPIIPGADNDPGGL